MGRIGGRHATTAMEFGREGGSWKFQKEEVGGTREGEKVEVTMVVLALS